MNSRIHTDKAVVANLSHDQTVCHTLKRFHNFKGPAMHSMQSLSSCYSSALLSYCSVKEMAGGRDRHSDVINDVSFFWYLTLMTSNMKYVSIFHIYWPIRGENRYWVWDKSWNCILQNIFVCIHHNISWPCLIILTWICVISNNVCAETEAATPTSLTFAMSSG